MKSIGLALFGLALMGFPQARCANSWLTVSEDGHYFLRDGRPFFWLGDTAWSLVNKYTQSETEFYMQRRRQQGFNVLNVMLIFNGGPGLKTATADEQGELPFVDMNPATPNDKYFRNVDRLVALARRNNMILAVLACGGSGGSFVKVQNTITSGNARSYGSWLGRRYRNDPNIVWVDGFDLPPQEYGDVAREFAAGVREGDAGSDLITYHPGGGYSSSYFQNEPWLAFNTIQTWAHYTKIYPMVHADYLRVPPRPVVMAEGAYEEGPEYPTAPITPLNVRQQAYWSYLAGGFHTYGHNDMWRKNPSWRHSLDSAGALQMGILKRVFVSRKWWRYAPYPSLIASGAGSEERPNVAARSADGDGAIVYVSSPGTVAIDLSRVTNVASVRAKWVNTETGKESMIGVLPSHGIHEFPMPASRPDAVLLLDAVRP
ncbi:MAG: DUF4038 domain-containing protein [Bryobacteraceae bacterium]|jgi:hypothetical protein